MSEPNVHDLASAHHELMKSLCLVGNRHPAREASEQALKDLAAAISYHTKRTVPSGSRDTVFESNPVEAPRFDWVLLPEDVSQHCMSGPQQHEDGRQCYYHSRLDSWVFAGRKGRITLKCLRGNHVD